MKRVALFTLALTLMVAGRSDQSSLAQPGTEPQMALVPESVAAAPAISTLTITVSASDMSSERDLCPGTIRRPVCPDEGH